MSLGADGQPPRVPVIILFELIPFPAYANVINGEMDLSEAGAGESAKPLKARRAALQRRRRPQSPLVVVRVGAIRDSVN